MHAKKRKEALPEPRGCAGCPKYPVHCKSAVRHSGALWRIQFMGTHVVGYLFNGLLTFGKDRETLVVETLSGGAVSRRKFSRMAR